jgi:hypothetical protein
VTIKQNTANRDDANEGVDAPTMDGVATETIPIKRLAKNCSIKVMYMPEFTRGIAQQQYSLAFMMRGRGKDEGAVDSVTALPRAV